MSKMVLVCPREGAQTRFFKEDIDVLAERIMPDNISPAPPLVIEDKGLLIGIFNPHDCILKKETSILMRSGAVKPMKS